MARGTKACGCVRSSGPPAPPSCRCLDHVFGTPRSPSVASACSSLLRPSVHPKGTFPPAPAEGLLAVALPLRRMDRSATSGRNLSCSCDIHPPLVVVHVPCPPRLPGEPNVLKDASRQLPRLIHATAPPQAARSIAKAKHVHRKP
eukprot:scaffold1822_cov333-Pavlova_lutheri.AAC.18